MAHSLKRVLVLLSFVCILASILFNVYAAPVGPVATQQGSSTRSTPGNVTLNESTGGGYIYTYSFNAIEQNERWKAYVGNVTGTLTLDDANNYTIYSWNLGTISGEVYATRNDSTVSWTSLNCSNITEVYQEDAYMGHSRLDNISATFSAQNHPSFEVGTTPIAQDSCYSILPYVNDSSQSGTEYFAEVIMYDGSTPTNGKTVYATLIEDDVSGYNGNDPSVNESYDFQMLVPERGTSDWSSSTMYYFYVELA